MGEVAVRDIETVAVGVWGGRRQRAAMVLFAVILTIGSLLGSAMLARASGDSSQSSTLQPIPAAAPVGVSTGATRQQVADAALVEVGLDLESLLPGWEVRVGGARAGLLGGTIWQDRVIIIWIRDGQTQHEVSHVLAHEIGHALDVTYLSDSDRAEWRRVRSYDPSVPWWPDNAADDYSTPAGDLAETTAVLLVGPDNYAGRNFPPTPSELDSLSDLLRRATGTPIP